MHMLNDIMDYANMLFAVIFLFFFCAVDNHISQTYSTSISQTKCLQVWYETMRTTFCCIQEISRLSWAGVERSF